MKKQNTTITSEWLTKIALQSDKYDDDNCPDPLACRPTGKKLYEVRYNGDGTKTVIHYNNKDSIFKRIWKALFSK